jgi:hypothetical protein
VVRDLIRYSSLPDRLTPEQITREAPAATPAIPARQPGRNNHNQNERTSTCCAVSMLDADLTSHGSSSRFRCIMFLMIWFHSGFIEGVRLADA